MLRYVASLRGINVGRRQQGRHGELSLHCCWCSATRMSCTNIQKWKLSRRPAPKPYAASMGRYVDDISPTGLARAAVVVVSKAELARIMAENPFPDEMNNKALHAVFCRDDIDSSDVVHVAAAVQRARDAGSRDEAVVVGRTLYLRTPDGMGRSDLAAQLLAREFRTRARLATGRPSPSSWRCSAKGIAVSGREMMVT